MWCYFNFSQDLERIIWPHTTNDTSVALLIALKIPQYEEDYTRYWWKHSPFHTHTYCVGILVNVILIQTSISNLVRRVSGITFIWYAHGINTGKSK